MRLPLLRRLRESRSFHGIAMERFYALLGISRQGYFQAIGRQEFQRQMMRNITEEVIRYRDTKDRRAGSRSLYFNLHIRRVYGMGINKFEHLMADYGLTLAPVRVKVVTTKSSKQSWNYSNLTKGLVVNDINQLVVGDLTYVVHGKERYFLFSLTDVYSARLVGYHFGSRMRAIEAHSAFEKWVSLRGEARLKNCIHHTDGGSQYFSDLYLGAMASAELRISVAKTCLDNGFAEQRNGLLKHHLMPTVKNCDGVRLEKEIERILYVYNHERKQEALGWRSPVEFEKYWTRKEERPEVKLYDREKKTRTKRKGF